MVKRGRNNYNNKVKKQEIIIEDDKISEDYCFECKDGGLLIVCDHKDCVKAYHPHCVGKEDETEEAEDAEWICGWHSCFDCKKAPRYQCFCCPKAVCQSCFKNALFARTRGSKGFCNDCLHLALLGEEGLDVDSDGERVDFKDRETYEGLFKEYWDIIKENEGLTVFDLHNADVQLKKGENTRVRSHKPQSDSDESIKAVEEEQETKDGLADEHDSDEAIQPVSVTTHNHKKPKKTPKNKKGSSRIEYVGWASKSLLEFLAAIGVDTSNKLTQSDVTTLINKYAQENKLFNPEKKKIIICDTLLRTLLKRRTISIYKINDAIEAHFRENLDQSEDDGYSSGYDEDNGSLPNKKQAWWRNVGSFQHKGSLMEKFQQKDDDLEDLKKIETPVKVDTPPVKLVYSKFATIVPENMKLVYLKKGFVESLLEKYEAFESKMTGCFVKVKSEPFHPKYPYQLLPVTGIKKVSGNVNKTVLLQVTTLSNDASIRMLSNDDLHLEDCEMLQQKIETGLIPKPTVVELEKKAKEIHEDITKYAITRELSLLKTRIDIANEKGRRFELFECRKRRDELQSEEEQLRMLNEVPKVTAEVIEVMPDNKETVNNDDVEIVPSNNPTEEMEDNNKMAALLPQE